VICGRRGSTFRSNTHAHSSPNGLTRIRLGRLVLWVCVGGLANGFVRCPVRPSPALCHSILLVFIYSHVLLLFILIFSSSFELCIGNPQDVLHAISERHKLEPAGEPSLQNAIEMARSSMRFAVPTPPCPNHVLLTDVARNRADLRIISHLPTHSSREILITFGSLTTVDPGNIYETLSSCVKDRIRISLVALAAEMKICRELCDKTGGTPLLLFALTSPPLLFLVAYI
jgi:Ssl1-like